MNIISPIFLHLFHAILKYITFNIGVNMTHIIFQVGATHQAVVLIEYDAGSKPRNKAQKNHQVKLFL